MESSFDSLFVESPFNRIFQLPYFPAKKNQGYSPWNLSVLEFPLKWIFSEIHVEMFGNTISSVTWKKINSQWILLQFWKALQILYTYVNYSTRFWKFHIFGWKKARTWKFVEVNTKFSALIYFKSYLITIRNTTLQKYFWILTDNHISPKE